MYLGNGKIHTIRFVFCLIVTRIGSDVVTTLSIRPLREIVRHANSTFYDSAERARERGNFTVAICQFTYLHCLLLRSRWLSLTGSGTLLALARHGSRSHIARTPAQGPNSMDTNFGLSFGLKNNLSFGLRFPTLRNCSKMGSLDMSQNPNGISIRFSSQNSSQNKSIESPP